eukprot:gene13392-15762_t
MSVLFEHAPFALFQYVYETNPLLFGEGHTLYLAVYYGRLDIFKVLEAQKYPVDLVSLHNEPSDDDPTDYLIEALANGHFQMFSYLLQSETIKSIERLLIHFIDKHNQQTGSSESRLSIDMFIGNPFKVVLKCQDIDLARHISSSQVSFDSTELIKQCEDIFSPMVDWKSDIYINQSTTQQFVSAEKVEQSFNFFIELIKSFGMQSLVDQHIGLLESFKEVLTDVGLMYIVVFAVMSSIKRVSLLSNIRRGIFLHIRPNPQSHQLADFLQFMVNQDVYHNFDNSIATLSILQHECDRLDREEIFDILDDVDNLTMDQINSFPKYALTYMKFRPGSICYVRPDVLRYLLRLNNQDQESILEMLHSACAMGMIETVKRHLERYNICQYLVEKFSASYCLETWSWAGKCRDLFHVQSIVAVQAPIQDDLFELLESAFKVGNDLMIKYVYSEFKPEISEDAHFQFAGYAMALDRVDLLTLILDQMAKSSNNSSYNGSIFDIVEVKRRLLREVRECGLQCLLYLFPVMDNKSIKKLATYKRYLCRDPSYAWILLAWDYYKPQHTKPHDPPAPTSTTTVPPSEAQPISPAETSTPVTETASMPHSPMPKVWSEEEDDEMSLDSPTHTPTKPTNTPNKPSTTTSKPSSTKKQRRDPIVSKEMYAALSSTDPKDSKINMADLIQSLNNPNKQYAPISPKQPTPTKPKQLINSPSKQPTPTNKQPLPTNTPGNNAENSTSPRRFSNIGRSYRSATNHPKHKSKHK